MTDTKAVAKPLTPEAEHVLRRHGTERPGSSKLNHEKRPGVFRCAGCGTEVFASDTKYESGSGWPSFWAPAGADRKGVVWGKSVSVRVDTGGRRHIKKKKRKN